MTDLIRYFYNNHFQTSKLCSCFDNYSTSVLSGLVSVSTVFNVRFFTGLCQVRSGQFAGQSSTVTPIVSKPVSSSTVCVGAKSHKKKESAS